MNDPVKLADVESRLAVSNLMPDKESPWRGRNLQLGHVFQVPSVLYVWPNVSSSKKRFWQRREVSASNTGSGRCPECSFRPQSACVESDRVRPRSTSPGLPASGTIAKALGKPCCGGSILDARFQIRQQMRASTCWSQLSRVATMRICHRAPKAAG